MGRKKDILILFAIFLIAVVLISGTKIQSVEDYYLMHLDDITSDSEIITLSIDCKQLLDHLDKVEKPLIDGGYIPEDGYILPPTEYVLRDGDSVFDILQRAVRRNSIHMEYQKASLNIFGSAYIKGLGHIYEYACGASSGWVYSVNNIYPERGVSSYKPKDGDIIKFSFSCEQNLIEIGED